MGQWRFRLQSSEKNVDLEVSDDEPHVDNSRLELLALVRGLEALDQPSRVTLITTSSYVRRGLKFGLDTWRDTQWQWERFGKMTPVQDDDLWQRVDRALQYHQVECRAWRIDAAHQGSGDHIVHFPRAVTGDDSGRAAAGDGAATERPTFAKRAFRGLGRCVTKTTAATARLFC